MGHAAGPLTTGSMGLYFETADNSEAQYNAANREVTYADGKWTVQGDRLLWYNSTAIVRYDAYHPYTADAEGKIVTVTATPDQSTGTLPMKRQTARIAISKTFTWSGGLYTADTYEVTAIRIHDGKTTGIQPYAGDETATHYYALVAPSAGSTDAPFITLTIQPKDGGTAKDLTLEGCSVTGNYQVGAIVGSNHGNISGCNVTDGTVSANGYVGGTNNADYYVAYGSEDIYSYDNTDTAVASWADAMTAMNEALGADSPYQWSGDTAADAAIVKK